MADRYFGLVPAGGRGTRLAGAVAKQYLALAGRPMLEHAVDRLAGMPAIAHVFVVLAPDDVGFADCSWGALQAKVTPLYCGGVTRAATVFNGLLAARGEIDETDWVLVHDAARPCLSRDELVRLLEQVGDDDTGGLLALPLADTLKRDDGAQRIARTVAREGLWRALTPQMFRYRPLVSALHASMRRDITDEASAIERMGWHPKLIRGAATNIKVTYPDDLALAEAILACQEAHRCG